MHVVVVGTCLRGVGYGSLRSCIWFSPKVGQTFLSAHGGRSRPPRRPKACATLEGYGVDTSPPGLLYHHVKTAISVARGCRKRGDGESLTPSLGLASAGVNE